MPFFDSRDTRYKDPFGASETGARIRFALRDEVYYGCELLVLREFAGVEDICALPPAEGGFAGEYTAPAEGELCWYAFRLTDGDGRQVWFGKNGLQDTPEKLSRWQLTVYEPSPTPSWFGEGVTYQIFPDRFRRVALPDVSHMVGRRWLHENWDDAPVYLPEENGEITNRDFFGGSLAGITEKLDYLQGLGVTTLYLNPIFEAASNHRYDTADYRAIDPLLGTEDDLRTLCREAHERGMRVLLDGVFNHTGSNSRYFNAEGFYPDLGAAQSESSPYYGWYSFHPWPSQYDAWWGVRTLPAVNEERADYRAFIFGGEDSVVRRWLRCGADGWRLDVADELPDELSVPHGSAGVAGRRQCRRLPREHGDAARELPARSVLRRNELPRHARHAAHSDAAGRREHAADEAGSGGVPPLPCRAGAGAAAAAPCGHAALQLPRLAHGVLRGRGGYAGLRGSPQPLHLPVGTGE